MFSLLKHQNTVTNDLSKTTLFNEATFYTCFLRDLKHCKSELIIESPYITNRRLNEILPMLQKLKSKKIRVVVNTRDPLASNEEYAQRDAQEAISKLQHIGVHVLFTNGHHRKLAILDRRILYEGSLNVLSQNNSCEVMRRIKSTSLAWQMIKFVGVDRYL